MSFRRLASVLAPLALSAAMLALGTAAAPGKARPSAHRSLRLVAKPGRIAPALLLAPGDRVQRLVTLRARGHGRFAAVYLVVRTRRRSPLGLDRKRGLQVALRSCSRRWRPRRASYSCAGRIRVLLSRRPLVGRSRLSGLQLPAGRRVHLKLIVTLPRQSPPSLADQATAVVYAFAGSRARGR